MLHCPLVLPVEALNKPGKKTSGIPSFTLSGCKEILLTFDSFTSWEKGSSLSGPWQVGSAGWITPPQMLLPSYSLPLYRWKMLCFPGQISLMNLPNTCLSILLKLDEMSTCTVAILYYHPTGTGKLPEACSTISKPSYKSQGLALLVLETPICEGICWKWIVALSHHRREYWCCHCWFNSFNFPNFPNSCLNISQVYPELLCQHKFQKGHGKVSALRFRLIKGFEEKCCE